MQPVRLTLLASAYPVWREAVIARAVAERPQLHVLRHELGTIATDGCIRRTISGPVTEDVPIPATKGCCLSCLLREDTLLALRALAVSGECIEVLLVLPPAVEPLAVGTVLAHQPDIRIDAVAVAVDTARVEQDLTADAPLASPWGLDDDDRRLPEVLTRQLAVADVVLATGIDARSSALLTALAPAARQLSPGTSVAGWLGVDLHVPERLQDLFQPGIPIDPQPVQHAGVSAGRWLRRRPLHPERLLATLEDGSLEGVVQVRGFLWVATRPGTALALDGSSRGYELAAVDAWLAAVPLWDRVPPRRRAAARQRWHPYYGDRVQELRIVTLDDDLCRVERELDACLLTDHELADGEDVWRRRPDPLRPWLGDEADLLARAGHDPTTKDDR